ncbi:MAG: hypothetical protein V4654_07355 [Bdellovibrionota bacterium]
MFKKTLLSFCLFFYLGSAHAVQIHCYEDEINPAARVVFLSSADSSSRVTAFEQTFNIPHPKEGMGYYFQQIKQSQGSGSTFPLGVYTGLAMIFKDNKEESYRGTLVIEEQGEWSFSDFKYQYQGTYLLHSPNDMVTGVDKSVIIPVNCRAQGLVDSPSQRALK